MKTSEVKLTTRHFTLSFKSKFFTVLQVATSFNNIPQNKVVY